MGKITKEELPDTDTDIDGTVEVQEDSTEDQDTSNTADSSEEDESPEKTEDKESEETEEETFDAKLSRMAKSMSDKSIKTYQQKDAEQTKRIQELEEQLDDRLWNLAIDDLFNEESDSEGEEIAQKRKEARQAVQKKYVEFKRNEARINKLMLELDERESTLNDAERTQMAREKYWLALFLEDKKKVEKLNKALEKDKAKILKTEDEEDLEIIVESFRSNVKSGEKKYKPDESRQEGTGIDWTKLSAAEKVARGLEKEKKKTGG